MSEGSFEVTTTVNMWEPPFNKETKVIEYIGSKNEEFDDEKSIKDNVFRILEMKADYAILQFHHQFTLKRAQFMNFELLVGNKQLKLPKDIGVELSFMWGSKGITKTIKYNGLVKSDDDKKDDSEDNGE